MIGAADVITIHKISFFSPAAVTLYKNYKMPSMKLQSSDGEVFDVSSNFVSICSVLRQPLTVTCRLM